MGSRNFEQYSPFDFPSFPSPKSASSSHRKRSVCYFGTFPFATQQLWPVNFRNNCRCRYFPPSQPKGAALPLAYTKNCLPNAFKEAETNFGTGQRRRVDSLWRRAIDRKENAFGRVGAHGNRFLLVGAGRMTAIGPRWDGVWRKWFLISKP
jgi:hypothetical protein